jgi:hypothetical protein
MNDINQNIFDNPKFNANVLILMLIPHKFDINALSFVLMSKKIDSEGHYNFIFS